MCEQLVQQEFSIIGKLIAYDCSLLEYYEGRVNKPILLLPKEKVSVKNYFAKDEDIPIFELGCGCNLPSYIMDILNKAEGKLSICGSSACISSYSDGYPNRLNLYFHSCDKLEMEDILKQTLPMLNVLQQCNSMRTNDYIKVFNKYTTVTFHTNIYKDQQSILQTMKSSEDKIGYNPFTGYFCTIVSGLLLSLRFCVDDYPMNIRMYEEESKPNIGDILFDGYKYLAQVFNKDILSVVFPIWLQLLINNAIQRLTHY